MTVFAFTLFAAALQTAAPAPAATPVAPEKKSCRSEVATGSIMAAKKICHTKSEWAAIDAANATNVDAIRNRTGRSSGLNTR